MPLSLKQVYESLADHMEERATARREIAKRAPDDEARQRQNRGSAELLLVAEHIRRQDETHTDLSNLHAWDDAQDRIGEYHWSPNAAQAKAIDRYADDAKAQPEALLAELNRLK